MEDSDSLLPVAVAIGLPVTASLGPVGPLLRQLHSRPEGEIQSLTADLDGLCISLMNHSEAEEPSYRAKSWMSEIRELCYDTKNYMDDALFLLKQDEDALLTAQEELTPEEKQEIAMLRFKALEDRVTDASRRSQSYKIDPHNINKAKFLSVARRRLPGFHPGLIGRGRLMDELSTLLRNGEELDAVSLVGPEGVGKTTLAKRLYHKIGGEFQSRAFVRVSPNPDMRMLLASIFTQIQLPASSECVSNSKPACSLDAQVLITKIQQYLRGKRYLIIIDDLWSISVWDIIRRAFPDDGRGSRIITTQSEDVASACCSYQSEYIFEMEPLMNYQSRKLLFSMVFGSVDHVGCSEDFLTVSDEIISKCGGLPLLIVNISSLLPTPSEPNLQQWKDIRDFLPSTMRTNPTSEGIKEVLNLIYSNLSPELKTCLLYLAMYPEGYTINKVDLVKQWVAEGFIGEGQNKEDIARGYFDELMRRGMIQTVDINYRGVLSCTLHHMVHDLIVKKSMEGNFVIGVDYFQSAVWLPDKVRRLSVQFGGARSAQLPDGITLSEVRSLAFFGFNGCADFIERCKLLRVLTLHVWADDCMHQSEEERPGTSPSREKKVLTYDLSGISKLLPLRYLKIACNIPVKLPEDIQALQYLETLEVDATVFAIPSDIGRLSRLSSLKIAVRVLSRQDIYILQALPALSALSLHVWEEPVEMIVFDNGKFSVLKYFKFRCSVPSLKFEAGAMPDLRHLKLCFNAREADQRGIVPIGIEHLPVPGFKEITAEIWGADTDIGSTFRTAISNHPSNPRIDVQLVASTISYGDTTPSMGAREKEYMSKDIDKEEEEEADGDDSRMSTSLWSSSRATSLDLDIMKEKFARLLLGEDMSGSGKGVSSALALSNAVTNLAASVFGEHRKLEPMAADNKERWKKEVGWLLSVTDYIVEWVPTRQTAEKGTTVETMSTAQRRDLQMNIPALRKLDTMIIGYMDSFVDQTEFWYEKGGENKLDDDKWWMPTVKVPAEGLSEVTRKWLQYQKDCVNEVLKAAMAINEQVLVEMEIPEIYIESLPKKGKMSLGDAIYGSIIDEEFDPLEFLEGMDLSTEHKILDLKNRIEAFTILWKRKIQPKDTKTLWGSIISFKKREQFEERAETILHLLKRQFPDTPQSQLDISKIQYNMDVGYALLESYSRVLWSLAYSVRSRIEDVLGADAAAVGADAVAATNLNASGRVARRQMNVPKLDAIDTTSHEFIFGIKKGPENSETALKHFKKCL